MLFVYGHLGTGNAIAFLARPTLIPTIGGNMKSAIALMILIATATSSLWAPTPVAVVPEINPAAIPAALALLGGGILVARSYFKR
jgi:hypothetical protein